MIVARRVCLAGITLLLCAMSAAQAGEATLYWEPPLFNTDGTPADDIAGYVVTWGKGSDYRTHSNVSDMNWDGYRWAYIQNLEPGRWYFSVRAYNTQRTESDAVTVDKEIVGPAPVVIDAPTPVPPPPRTPAPPTNVRVSSPIAYTIQQKADSVQLVRSGTVPLGTTCDTTQTVNGLNVVPRSAVTLTKYKSAKVVLAECHG